MLVAGLSEEVACSSTRCFGQLGAHSCAVQATCTGSVSSKLKQTESVSSTMLNIPRLKLKVGSDSEEASGMDGYNFVSSLQSLKLKNQLRMHECDFQNDIASDEYNDSFTLAVAAGQGSRALEPQPLKESSQLSSLAQLANKHLSEAVKLKLCKCTSFSPLTQCANKCVSKVHDQALLKNDFSSLAQLAERHNGVTKLPMSNVGNSFLSRAKLANRRLEVEVQAEGHFTTSQELGLQHQRVQSRDCVSSLADLASQHVKVHEDMKASDSTRVKETNKYVDLKTDFVLSPGSKVSESSGHELGLSVDHKSDYNFAIGLHAESEREGAELCLFSEKMGKMMIDCYTSLEMGSNVTSVKLSPVVRTQSEEENDVNWEIDLTSALLPPGSKSIESFSNLKPEVTDFQLNDEEQKVPDDIVVCDALEVRWDFDPGFKILDLKLPLTKRRSSFGRTLCRKWKNLPTPYTVPRIQSVGKVVAFTFNTFSPDDKFLRCQRRK
jgi:hypothetical protein